MPATGRVPLIFILFCFVRPIWAESIYKLEDFESYTKGVLPEKGWLSRQGSPKGIYVVDSERNGNRFLRAEDQGQSVQFFKEITWNIRKYPLLSWRWWVQKFPTGADERVAQKNDSAAAIYVVFPRFFIPEVIKYVWSAVVPEKTWIVRNDHYPMLIVRSGVTSKGIWVTEKRNVLDDYKVHFGHSPPNPVAFGFLTDANETKSSAEADYDDILATDFP